jgi:hypothetical protein
VVVDLHHLTNFDLRRDLGKRCTSSLHTHVRCLLDLGEQAVDPAGDS